MIKKQNTNAFRWTVIAVFVVTLLILIGQMGLQAIQIYRYNHNLSSQLMTALFALGPIVVAVSAFLIRKGVQFERLFFGALFGSIYFMFSVGIPTIVQLIMFRSNYAQDWMLYESMLSGAMILVGVFTTYKLVNAVDIR